MKLKVCTSVLFGFKSTVKVTRIPIMLSLSLKPLDLPNEVHQLKHLGRP